jgi:hypothetical protein
MKKLLLLLLLSLSFGVSADTITYDNFGRGSDGSKCKENTIGGIDCSGGGINGTVRYRSLGSPNRFDGDDGSTCKVNGIGKLVCERKNKVSEDYNKDPNAGRVSVEAASQAGALLGKGLIGILEALAGNTTQQNNSMQGKRLYEKGTAWRWNGSKGSGTDGLQCSLKDDKYFISCNNDVSYYICYINDIRRTCGTDGTYYTSDWKGDDSYYCLTSNFGSKCCGAADTKICN